MRVLLKEVLDCDPDAAWRAIRSPAVFAEVSSPLLVMESHAPDGLPTVWEPGDHLVTMRGGGIVPLGKQTINLSMQTLRHGDVRILRDTGRGVSGSLAAVTLWDHRMAIAADPAGTGKTLYRDQLIFRAGPATLALWPAFWSFWQWRMLQLKRLAPTWRFDVGVDDSEFARSVGNSGITVPVDDAGFPDLDIPRR
jgi:hypothetical protein